MLPLVSHIECTSQSCHPCLPISASMTSSTEPEAHSIIHFRQGKVKVRVIGVYQCLTATGTHVPYGITQCYLPPGRGSRADASRIWYSKFFKGRPAEPRPRGGTYRKVGEIRICFRYVNRETHAVIPADVQTR